MARRGRGLGIAALVVGLLGLMPAIGTFVYGRSAYGVGTQPSGSMAPMYKAGERIVWEQVDGSEVRRGDVVLFSAPDRYGAEGVHMQRVIGVGGDRVACCTLVGSQERVTVNGRPIKEPYVSGGDADGGHGQYDVKVPQGRLFLLGDHRADAMDSRFFAKDHGGTVPVDAVRGRMTDNRTILVLLGSALLLGAVLFLTGIGLGIGFLAVRRRKAPPVSPAPWPTQPVQV
ncbi:MULTISPECIES: signal peptidase I [unclassified Streptomyces]|uniref:signal peptidase I n=1 Tax=unclassified Streptomyces TaxID=2593676 RepID=UPI0022549130|nr:MULTISPECIES: signal peptidase I [unclassified Streptomyces]MCX5048607.1 signal peptidase I [Streptomyces sp. NBC_00474]